MRPIAEAPLSEHFCVFETDIGPCGIAWSKSGVTRFQLPEATREATERRLQAAANRPTVAAPPPGIARAIVDLQRYFTGEQAELTHIAVDLTGVSPFYSRVYEATRQIGWGETLTYGELAQRAGSPGAARGIGQAMSRNPIPVIIPCHRVLASGNKIGGFSAFGGTTSKERLLGLEGVRVGRQQDKRQLSLSERW